MWDRRQNIIVQEVLKKLIHTLCICQMHTHVLNIKLLIDLLDIVTSVEHNVIVMQTNAVFSVQ